MRHSCFVLSTVLLLPFAASSFAIDGNRPGFTLGLDLGYNSTESITNQKLHFNKSQDGFGISFLIGAGTEHNLLAFAITGGEIDYNYPGATIGSSITVFFQELRWYHYFGRTGHSVFSCVGFGVVDLSSCRSPYEGSGLGYLLGGGVEVTKEISIGMYYHGGYAEDDGYRHGVTLFQVLATIIAY